MQKTRCSVPTRHVQAAHPHLRRSKPSNAPPFPRPIPDERPLSKTQPADERRFASLLHLLQDALHLVHGAGRVVVLVLVVVEAAHAAHLVAVAVLIARVVDVFFGCVFGDVFFASKSAWSRVEG